jgi:hypothetical protein
MFAELGIKSALKPLQVWYFWEYHGNSETVTSFEKVVYADGQVPYDLDGGLIKDEGGVVLNRRDPQWAVGVRALLESKTLETRKISEAERERLAKKYPDAGEGSLVGVQDLSDPQYRARLAAIPTGLKVFAAALASWWGALAGLFVVLSVGVRLYGWRKEARRYNV